LKKSKDGLAHEGKHNLQWSREFLYQHNVHNIDVIAMLGGVNLGKDADCDMVGDLSIGLPEAWHFYPARQVFHSFPQ